jgi:hypothetical protein
MNETRHRMRELMMGGSDADTLQRRMQAVRRELDDELQEITEKVHELGEWQSYVKTYPWICLGTAAVLG